MKSDIHLYVLFQAYPELLAKITHIDLNVPYAFESATFKDVVRMVDGWLRPLSNEGTHYVIEFDNWPNKEAYFKVALAMAQAGIQGTKGPVKGRLVFLNRAVDPRSEPWAAWADSELDGLRVYYLDEELARLDRNDPSDLLVAILRPMVINSPNELKKHVAEDYHRINQADLPDSVKGKILQIFFDWLMQVFKTSSVAEVREMFMLLTPLEECRPYREIIEIGEKKGIEIGEKKGIEIGEKKGIEIGEKKGIEIGEKKGIEIGEKKGIEIGEKKGIEIGEKKGIEIGEKKGIEIGEKKGILLGKIQQIEELFKEKVIQQHYYEAQLTLLTKQLKELGS